MTALQSMAIPTTQDTYEKDGYILKPGLLGDDKIGLLENTVAQLMGIPSDADLIAGLQAMEQKDKQRFYQICTGDLWYTVAALSLMADPKLVAAVGKCANTEPGRLSPVGYGLFWNDPTCPRLHYTWHQEAPCYPGMHDVVSVWFPMVYNLTPESGAMLLARGSQKQALDFVRIPQHLGVTQMEIDDQIAEKFEPVNCAIDRGDVVIFHQNTIHKTGENLSKRPRLSGIIRYADLTKEDKKTPYWSINPQF
ncbi:MAG: hypothetical protein COA42_01930 [Alteromonadaceae bacterium]|nr:MAG: hypothetical protein COA42_01930 [Alteromonadaceae bacterium]